MSSIVEKFDNKKVLLWGYGREGKASLTFLNTYCNPSSVEVFEGKREDLPIDDYDIVIKSPGVPYFDYEEKNITSMTELFLEEFKDNTVGITGTKGKSTTTSLIYHVLKENLDRKVCLLGNIGIPCMEAYEDMKNGALAVLEMSCHQLVNNNVSPHISVFLNLYEDHLDYYHTKEAYFKAKTKITTNQSESDYFFVGEDVPSIVTKAQTIKLPKFNEPKYEMKLLGIHNQWNADVAFTIAIKIFGCNNEAVINSIKTFESLPHRLEYFATINNVSFYDDSISTIPEATVNAIESVKDAKCMIVGGMDRGIDYQYLIDAIPDYQNVNFILCYESGKRILESVRNCTNVYYVDNLDLAVKLAKDITKDGACILSPAAASYGYFKNFEERGDYFKKLVNENACKG